VGAGGAATTVGAAKEEKQCAEDYGSAPGHCVSVLYGDRSSGTLYEPRSYYCDCATMMVNRNG
jgi:hypothetical protein